MIRAIGECGLYEDSSRFVLCSPRGPLAQWRKTRLLASATLQHPPRFAMLVRPRRGPPALVLIDPASGAEHAHAPAPHASSLLGFAPLGDVLLVRSDAGVDGYSADTATLIWSSSTSRRWPGSPPMAAQFAASGGAALTWGAGIVRFDVATGEVTSHLSVLNGRALADDQLDAACVVDARDVRLWSVSRRAFLEPVTSIGSRSVRDMWRDASFRDIAIELSSGELFCARIEAGDRVVERRQVEGLEGHIVDVAMDTGLVWTVVHDDGFRLATVHGTCIASVDGWRAGFTSSGKAYIMIGRALHLLNGAAAEVVEGPGDVIDVGPHPKGLIVVDAGLRSHVVACA